jgi:hypothetical protein
MQCTSIPGSVIRPDKLPRHLKESEWRWNHRRDNLYALLLKEIRSARKDQKIIEPFSIPGRVANLIFFEFLASLNCGEFFNRDFENFHRNFRNVTTIHYQPFF